MHARNFVHGIKQLSCLFVSIPQLNLVVHPMLGEKVVCTIFPPPPGHLYTPLYKCSITIIGNPPLWQLHWTSGTFIMEFVML